MIELCLQATAVAGSVIPELSLHVPLPGKVVDVRDTVFEQLFAQLHDRHALISCRRQGSEAQLWSIAMTGEGARVLWTDGTDAGGMFRASISKLCEELQSPPPLAIEVTEVEPAPPLLIHTPNYIIGDGNEEFLPNPACFDSAMLERFKFLGTLMGASARSAGFIELDLASLVWKAILGENIGFHELRSIDSRTAAHFESVASADDEEQWQAAQESAPICWSVTLINGHSSAVRADGSARVAFTDRLEYLAAAESRSSPARSRHCSKVSSAAFPQSQHGC
jgi:hypothetical protein